jgi:NADP-dependent 3-hydroxy acid dehydrogenase YdfG
MSELKNKIALVTGELIFIQQPTGSTDGIGLGIAKVLVKKGCQVVRIKFLKIKR